MWGVGVELSFHLSGIPLASRTEKPQTTNIFSYSGWLKNDKGYREAGGKIISHSLNLE
jgi:hypothetical protein